MLLTLAISSQALIDHSFSVLNNISLHKPQCMCLSLEKKLEYFRVWETVNRVYLNSHFMCVQLILSMNMGSMTLEHTVIV